MWLNLMTSLAVTTKAPRSLFSRRLDVPASRQVICIYCHVIRPVPRPPIKTVLAARPLPPAAGRPGSEMTMMLLSTGRDVTRGVTSQSGRGVTDRGKTGRPVAPADMSCLHSTPLHSSPRYTHRTPFCHLMLTSCDPDVS